MATIAERPTGFKAKFDKNGRNCDVPYLVRNATSWMDAYLTAKAKAESLSVEMGLLGLSLGSIEVDHHRNDFQAGLMDYEVVINFSNSENNKEREEGEETISWSTLGGTEKVMQAIDQVAYPVKSGSLTLPAPEVGYGINVTADGVEGVEQPASKLEWSLNHWFSPSFLNDAYLHFIKTMSARVNSEAWRSHGRWELLFLGGEAAEYSPTQTKPVKVSFKFAGSPTAVNIVIPRMVDGGSITIDTKLGWEYLWFLHEKIVDPASKVVIQVPRAAYVAKTKLEFNFNELGLTG